VRSVIRPETGHGTEPIFCVGFEVQGHDPSY
jgi:hypothetical protein